MVAIIGGASEPTDREKFIGTWTIIDPPGWEERVIYKFSSNGNFRWYDIENLGGYDIMGTWEISDEQLVVHWTYPTEKTGYYNYSFTDNCQNLNLTQGSTSMILSKMQDEVDDTDKIIGTWSVEFPQAPPEWEGTIIFHFYSNGNFRWYDPEDLGGYNFEGTWDWVEGQIVLYQTYPEDTLYRDYFFTNNDQTLTLIIGTQGTFVLTKMQDEVDDTDKIIGTWSVEFPQAPPGWGETIIWKFHSNGSYHLYDPEDLDGYNFQGSWDWIEGQIVLYQTYPYEGTFHRDYFFTNNDQTLTLIIETEGTFILTKIQEEQPGWIYGTVMCTMENGEEGFLENAEVSVYDGSYVIDSTYTDESGHYSISVPVGNYSVFADKEGYYRTTHVNVEVTAGTATEVDITLIKIQETENGWVYGTVLLRSNNVVYPANNISICLYPSNEDTSGRNYILQKGPCSFTNENGEFVIYSVDPGTYMIKAVKSKIYSSEQFIEIIGGQGTEVNFVINITETRLEIEKSILSGDVGGEVHVSKENGAKYEYDIMIYDGVSIEVTYLSFGKMFLIVSGDEHSSGRTIAILTDLEMFNTTSDFAVEYDGESIKMADNISDVLNPNNDGIHAEYLITIGADGIEILISIPHFSEHEITISTLQPEGPVDEIVESVGGINAIMLYLSICIVASVLFIGTIYMRRKL